MNTSFQIRYHCWALGITLGFLVSFAIQPEYLAYWSLGSVLLGFLIADAVAEELTL